MRSGGKWGLAVARKGMEESSRRNTVKEVKGGGGFGGKRVAERSAGVA